MTEHRGVKVRKDLRLALYLRDQFTCVWCDKDLHGAEPDDVTLDHLIPQSKGGTNKPSNLVTACRHCNCSRKTIPWRTFAKYSRSSVRSWPWSLRIKLIENTRRRSILRFRKLAKAIILTETTTHC